MRTDALRTVAPLSSSSRGTLGRNSVLCHRSGLFANDRTVDGVDQNLNLDEFEARPLGLVAIEWRGESLGKGVAILGHSSAGLFQRLKSLAHVGFAFCWWRDQMGCKGRAEVALKVRL